MMRTSALSVGLHGAVSGSILAALLLIAAPATAAPLLAFGIDEEIWFPVAGDNTGVDRVRAPEYVWNSSYEPLCAGGGVFIASGVCSGLTDYQLRVDSQARVLPAIQFPQGGANPVSVSVNDPFIADTIWAIRNTTGDTLLNTLLIFTNAGLSNFPGGYPDIPNGDGSADTGDGKVASAFGLDADTSLLKILEFSSGTTDYYYGVGALGDLLPGETAFLTVRYIVNNETMPVIGNDVILPPLAVLGATVPEPSTGLLLLSGLLGLAAAGRRRS